MNCSLRVRLTLLLAVLAVVVLPSAASAQNTCNVFLSSPLIVTGNTISATFQNPTANCTATIGLASYQRFGPSINNQVLFDGISFQLAGGTSQKLTTNLPPCQWQADAFFGQLLTSFAGGVRYGPRLLDTDSGGSGNCGVLGCTVTFGFWKNHPEAWPVTSLTLGTVTYTQAQLLQILKEPVRGNGLISLAHQLIGANLNQLSGASIPSEGGQAMAAANTLIGSLVVPPIGNGFIDPSVSSGLNNTLDRFNNGILPGGPAHCP